MAVFPAPKMGGRRGWAGFEVVEVAVERGQLEAESKGKYSQTVGKKKSRFDLHENQSISVVRRNREQEPDHLGRPVEMRQEGPGGVVVKGMASSNSRTIIGLIAVRRVCSVVREVKVKQLGVCGVGVDRERWDKGVVRARCKQVAVRRLLWRPD